MALELRQSLKLTQQLIMTPQLQQAIKLLQLSRLELLENIYQELETNPLLEDTQGDVYENEQRGEGEIPETTLEQPLREIEIVEKVGEDFDWESYLDEYNVSTPVLMERDSAEEPPSFDQRLTRKNSLYEHLIWQIRLLDMTREQQETAAIIAGNLNKDGYLDASLDEIAEMAEATLEQVESALYQVQRLDPPGVAARDLRECLLIQAENLGVQDALVTEIIKKHLQYLENKNYQGLVRILKKPPEEIRQAITVILHFNPRPGKDFGEDEIQYISPDIYVTKVDNEFMIVLNEDGLPKLRVSSYYKDALSSESASSSETKEYIQNKLRSAAWLIRSIHQRQRTIYKVAQSIINFQRDFLERGVAHLKPMILRDVAEDVGMHESTISRVTTNKYMHTPQGIFELKYFFNNSISSFVGDPVASESVKERIRQIVQDEDASAPLSDHEIVELLEKENISIARRTVAKYREVLGILPSSKRRETQWGASLKGSGSPLAGPSRQKRKRIGP
jgi:RNA polymerase sigma-54 factor